MSERSPRAVGAIAMLRHILAIVLAALGLIALAACGSSRADQRQSHTQSAESGPAAVARPEPQQTEVVADSGDDEDTAGTAGDASGPAAVTGRIAWPDGVAASGVTIEFYPNGYPYGGQAGGERVVTAADGSYSLPDCPCPELGGLFVLPPTGGDWAHGGNQCYIMLAAANGQLTGSADPGDEVDWSMLNMPCARDYIRPQTIREEVANIEADPQTLSGGPWQNARDRVS